MEIRFATYDDLDSLILLLRAYHVNSIADADKKDGFVTTNITKEQLQCLIDSENGVTVAVDGKRVIGFALAGSWDFWKSWPFFVNMMDHLEEFQLNGCKMTVRNSYQYGPVCVDKAYRGKGVFEEIFSHSLRHMSAYYPYMVTFVNQINPRSYAAHTRKAGMTEAGKFDWNGNHYWLFPSSSTVRRTRPGNTPARASLATWRSAGLTQFLTTISVRSPTWSWARC